MSLLGQLAITALQGLIGFVEKRVNKPAPAPKPDHGGVTDAAIDRLFTKVSKDFRK